MYTDTPDTAITTGYKRHAHPSPDTVTKRPKLVARKHFSDESSDEEMENEAMPTLTTVIQKRTIFDSDSDD